MIRLLLADDHELFRDGLASVLSTAEDIEVVGMADDGSQALRMAEDLVPDVILMDVNMPGVDGLTATRQIQQLLPQCRILMLTISERGDDLFEAVRAGARGYLLKNTTSPELLAGIRRVHEGEAIVAPAMAAKLLDAFASLSPEPAPAPEEDDLTPREREVVRQVARGLPNKEIASELEISLHTVKAHLRRALDKLQLRSRTEAALWAARHGLDDETSD